MGVEELQKKGSGLTMGVKRLYTWHRISVKERVQYCDT